MADAAAADRQYVDYGCIDHVATIAMNRPEKLNAVSDEVARQLMAAFRRFDADTEAHVARFRCARRSVRAVGSWIVTPRKRGSSRRR